MSAVAESMSLPPLPPSPPGVYTGPYTHFALPQPAASRTTPADPSTPPPELSDVLVNLTPHPIGLFLVQYDQAHRRGGERGEGPLPGQSWTPGQADFVVPSHGIARVEETVTTRGALSYWVPDCTGPEPIRHVEQGNVTGLPPVIASGRDRHYLTPRGEAPHSGQRRVWFIVSAMTALALRAAGDFREDVLIPHGEVRDGGGRIIGVRAFARYVLALNS